MFVYKDEYMYIELIYTFNRPCLSYIEDTDYLSTKATNADKAAESAYRQVSTMLPGAGNYSELQLLSLPHRLATGKEENFVKQVVAIGQLLKIPVTKIRLQTVGTDHHCVTIQHLGKHLLDFYPAKLLAGNSSDNLAAFQKILKDFWSTYIKVNPSHPVYRDFPDTLNRCIPCKMHSDEGTGLRRSAVQQWSWGPVLSDSANSLDRYFFFSCANAELYKAYNSGYAIGNSFMDDVCQHFATQAAMAYTDGLFSEALGRFHLVFVGLEGDLPAQARAYRLCRHFRCSPNPMCPWCEADDLQTPFTDNRDCARWRNTVCASRPWESEGPLAQIPGGNSERFLAKDLFHLCHLGAVRGFAVNFLCYLVTISCFVSWPNIL